MAMELESLPNLTRWQKYTKQVSFDKIIIALSQTPLTEHALHEATGIHKKTILPTRVYELELLGIVIRHNYQLMTPKTGFNSRGKYKQTYFMLNYNNEKSRKILDYLTKDKDPILELSAPDQKKLTELYHKIGDLAVEQCQSYREQLPEHQKDKAVFDTFIDLKIRGVIGTVPKTPYIEIWKALDNAGTLSKRKKKIAFTGVCALIGV